MDRKCIIITESTKGKEEIFGSSGLYGDGGQGG